MDLYNELIAEELAHDYNIKCSHYDLVEYMDNLGVISENFLQDNDKFLLLYDVLKEYFKENETLEHNNFKDIYTALEYKYDSSIASKIIDELKNVYTFDVLVANIDRHDKNIGIIENDTISLSPLFDNEKILSKNSIYEEIYSLRLDDNYNEEINDKLEEKIWIIDNNNISKVFERIEYRINSNIPDFIKDETRYRFSENKKRIMKKR